MSRDAPSPPASVLLAFRAINTRSFQSEIELSLLSTRLSEPSAVRTVAWNDAGGTAAVLPVAALYGANASGKTNVLRAMDDMRHLVLRSFKAGDATSPLAHHPFLLDRDGATAPTTLEVEIVLDGVRHEYGFSYDADEIVEEWAFRWPKGRRSLLFHRERDVVALPAGSKAAGRDVQRLLRSNALFLSTAAAIDHAELTPLYAWFSRNLRYAEETSRAVRQLRTVDLLQDPRRSDQVIALLRAADLGVADAQVREADPELVERVKKAVRIIAGQEDESEGADFDATVLLNGVELFHASEDGPIAFEASDESLGTLVWLGLIGPVVDALLLGAVLLADELDASLHPALVGQLVRLFQSPTTNPNRAQLILNLHDVSLLSSDRSHPVGRDQVWLTEKDNHGGSRLLALADQAPRKGEAMAERYLAGRYGGKPVVSDAEFDVAVERLLAVEAQP